jgi:phage terminase large subunit-like protein
MPRYATAVIDAIPVAGAEWESMQLAARAALALDGQAEPWTPYAHQIAPPGDWDVWLLLAGRGAGKTDAAAHFTNEHMTGPPCMPGIPGGHRIAIVAPTLGDATEACVNGPSGLKAHNPSVRLVNRTGGTFVIWPSGAEAKLFGAHGPDDVERLRAGGNRCLAWA